MSDCDLSNRYNTITGLKCMIAQYLCSSDVPLHLQAERALMEEEKKAKIDSTKNAKTKKKGNEEFQKGNHQRCNVIRKFQIQLHVRIMFMISGSNNCKALSMVNLIG